MKCPYCENTMEKGYVQPTGGNELFWTRNKSTLFVTADDIDMPLTQSIGIAAIEGHICKKCSKIILDI